MDSFLKIENYLDVNTETVNYEGYFLAIFFYFSGFNQ